MTKKIKVGVVGATGMVGKVFMSLLQERKFPVSELRLFASESSAGKTVPFLDQEIPLQVLAPHCFDGLDLVFFSSGDEISRDWAPQAVQSGAFAVDNSAAFRMSPEHHLVVPEVNGHLLKTLKPQIIANPNCSTIQLVVTLKPLMDQFGLSSVRVASYQAVSGGGQTAYDELVQQMREYEQDPDPVPRIFPHQIAYNCIPQIGSFNEQGFSSEEVKIMTETRKILNAPQIKVSAFTVRVPVLNAHAEAVWVTLDQEVSREQILTKLIMSPGIQVMDNPGSAKYPMQKTASGKDPVFVGRIHQDMDDPKTWLMWIVADNIRKGAALNGIQIAESIFDIK